MLLLEFLKTHHEAWEVTKLGGRLGVLPLPYRVGQVATICPPGIALAITCHLTILLYLSLYCIRFPMVDSHGNEKRAFRDESAAGDGVETTHAHNYFP